MVNPKKEETVRRIIRELATYPVIGLVDLSGLPTKELQEIRKKLKGNLLLVTRKSLLKLAIKNSKKENLSQLLDKKGKIPALILSRENPFKLALLLEKNKTPAFAKAGQTASEDIIVKAGPTPFTPGPVISELSNLGIKTGVEGGKISIKEDKILVKKGERISPKVAEILKKLDLRPEKIGINLLSVWENGSVFDSDLLEIDQDKYCQEIAKAYQTAFYLSTEIFYPCQENLEFLLKKGFIEAFSLETDLKNKLSFGG